MTTKDLCLLMPMVAVLLPASPGVAQSVNYETVMVGNPGNVADTTGYGAVPYEYLIGKHEVTIGQYTEFLNAVAKNDPYSLWNASMASDPKRAGISRSGTNGAYAYSAKAPAGETPPGASSPGDRPIGWIDWFDAARFANWMHNGQASGNTETGAYTLNGLTGGTARARSPGARFFIPTENEWYKSAYYSPALKSGSGGYFSYATQSNNAPGNIIGSGSNQANYNTGVYSVTQSATFSATQNYLTDVGAFGGAKSFYGTFDQSGNLYEWYDSDAINNASPGIRGGGFESTPYAMSSAYRGPPNALSDGWTSGFRLASSLASTSAYLGTLGQASKWLITGAGAVNAPSFAKNLGRAGDITLTSSGSASGTFVQGASGSQFTGYWHAEQRFFIPANATAMSLMFDSLYGNDRVVLRLNTTDVGNTNFNAIVGVGVMGLAENTPDVPYNFTQTTSGTQTAGFVVGGWNTLRMIVNNNGTYPTHATRTAPFQFTEDVTAASVNAVLTYSVLPTGVVFNVSSGTQTQEASGYLTLDSSALSVTKSGSGTLVLGGSNSYTGPTVIAGGALALGNANSLGKDGVISFAGGALMFTSSNTSDYSARFSTAANQAYKVDTNGRNVTFASALVSAGGSLTKLGPGLLTLTGSNSFSGGATIFGGTLSIGNGGTAGAITGDITNNGTLVFSRSDASIFSGALSGSGAISKRGAGNLKLTNANTLTGSTAIQQGTLQLAHAAALSTSTISVLTGGTLALTPGLVTAVGGLKPSSGGIIDVGNGMITVADGLSVLNLYASLSVGRGSGSWDGARGIKSSSAAASVEPRTVGWLDNGDGSVTFGYAAAGDANLDWTIDIIDIATFLGSGKFNSGLTATWAEGDFNYDGFADITDIADFISSGLFNAGPYNAPAGTIAAVPEPSVLGMFGVGAGVSGLMAMRRKRAI